MTTIYAQCGKTIPIGRAGENLARKIVFDVSDWRREWPDGSIKLLVQRGGDTVVYPQTVTDNGTLVTWTITSVVTTEGGGKAELQLWDGDTVAKSQVWRTMCIPALGEASETPPEGAKSWVDEVLTAANTAQAAAEQAEAAAVHSPKIEDGTWRVWDGETGAYTDTGVKAQGERAEIPDYNENDPESAAYIKNRPCYFTGDATYEPFLSTTLGGLKNGYILIDKLLTAGDEYLLTIKATSVTLTAFYDVRKNTPCIAIGDSSGTLTPVYGFYAIATTGLIGNVLIIFTTDQAAMMTTFGLTEEDLSDGSLVIRLDRVVRKTGKKLDKRLLPEQVVQLNLTDYGLSLESGEYTLSTDLNCQLALRFFSANNSHSPLYVYDGDKLSLVSDITAAGDFGFTAWMIRRGDNGKPYATTITVDLIAVENNVVISNQTLGNSLTAGNGITIDSSTISVNAANSLDGDSALPITAWAVKTAIGAVRTSVETLETKVETLETKVGNVQDTIGDIEPLLGEI